jgi:hypothetical protein
MNKLDFDELFKKLWPWDISWYKIQKGRIDCLKTAGALSASEIERLQRLSDKELAVKNS